MAEGRLADSSQLSNVAAEFTCPICCEIFVRPHTLACSHSFCEPCLAQWMEKKSECPVCRSEISTLPVYCLALENAADRFVESLGPELKQTRKEQKASCQSHSFSLPEVATEKEEEKEEGGGIPWGALAVGAIAGAAVAGFAIASLTGLFSDKPREKEKSSRK